MPKNVGKTPDEAGRGLDCMVLNNLHKIREETKQVAYDSVRGPFLEGEPIYDTAGFRSHSHIQICVRSLTASRATSGPSAQTERGGKD